MDLLGEESDAIGEHEFNNSFSSHQKLKEVSLLFILIEAPCNFAHVYDFFNLIVLL